MKTDFFYGDIYCDSLLLIPLSTIRVKWHCIGYKIEWNRVFYWRVLPGSCLRQIKSITHFCHLSIIINCLCQGRYLYNSLDRHKVDKYWNCKYKFGSIVCSCHSNLSYKTQLCKMYSKSNNTGLLNVRCHIAYLEILSYSTK